MPHQCVHCSKVYPDAAKELLAGCSCGSRFFYYIKKEYYDKLNQINNNSKSDEDSNVEVISERLKELEALDKVKIESDVREMIGVSQKEDVPIILDLESIRVLTPGKFEIDVVNLFSKKRPLIYKLEEGKYIIDLASTLKLNNKELKDKIETIK